MFFCEEGEPVPAERNQECLVPRVYGTPVQKHPEMFGTPVYMDPGFGSLDRSVR